MALLEVNRRRGADDGISQWVFEGTTGRISARDGNGNLVMALAADPLFGPRLAAAFSSPRPSSLDLLDGLRRSAPVPPAAASA